MLFLLRIALVAGLFSCILQADVYTYQYSGADFDTHCSTFVGCVAESGIGRFTGYATFSQPLAANQTVDSNSAILLDWQLDGPSGFGGSIGNFTLLLTTGANRQITSWNLYDRYDSGCFFNYFYCVTDIFQSSSEGGDYFSSEFDIYYDSYSTSTTGTWTPGFVLTPEPASTPLAKLVMMLAMIAGVIIMRHRERLAPAGNG